MCNVKGNIHQFKERAIWYFKALKVLWKRELKTETHRKLWLEFERVLVVRSNLAMMANIMQMGWEMLLN